MWKPVQRRIKIEKRPESLSSIIETKENDPYIRVEVIDLGPESGFTSLVDETTGTVKVKREKSADAIKLGDILLVGKAGIITYTSAKRDDEGKFIKHYFLKDESFILARWEA